MRWELLRKGRKLAKLCRDVRYLRALRHGVAAAIEHEAVPFETDYRTVIDVGAGRGQFALFALSRFPRARIISFEALPASFGIARSVLSRESRVDLRHAAAAARSDTAVIHVTRDKDSSSLRPLGEEQLRRFPATELETKLEVPAVRLDEALSFSLVDPVLLKLDVQGAELDVLEGGRELLSRVTTVVSECSFIELYQGQALFDDVAAFLREEGFRVAGVFSPVYGEDKVCIQADVLFERR